MKKVFVRSKKIITWVFVSVCYTFLGFSLLKSISILDFEKRSKIEIGSKEKQCEALAEYFKKIEKLGVKASFSMKSKEQSCSYGEGRYYLASVSKTMTGALYQKLAKENNKFLETKVCTLLKEDICNPEQENITLQHLLDHQSGLGRISPNLLRDLLALVNKFSDFDPIEDRKDILSQSLRFKLGELNYSNQGFRLLAHILAEKYAKQDIKNYYDKLETLYREKLNFKKLSVSRPGELDPEERVGYPLPFFPKAGLSNTILRSRHEGSPGSGFIKATMQDLAAWAFDYMQSGLPFDPKREKYSNGIIKTVLEDGTTTYWHNGGSYVSTSGLYFFPKSNHVVAFAFKSGFWHSDYDNIETNIKKLIRGQDFEMLMVE